MLTAPLTIALTIRDVRRVSRNAAESVSGDVAMMAGSGMTQRQITAWMRDNAEERLEAAASAMTREIMSGINAMTYSASFGEVQQESPYFRWTWEPTAKHCADCTERNNKVGTAAEMVAKGMPATGTTKCHHNCRCRLVPITREEYDAGTKIL